MRRLLPFILLALAGAALAQRAARGPVDHFHDAARMFVAGDTADAAREARAGLALAPGDRALQALLAEILRRPPPQQGGGGGEPPPPREQENDQRPPDPGQGDQPREPGDAPERPRPQDDGAGDEDDRRPAPESRGDESPQRQPSDAVPPRGRMTREEAEALLRALGADERRLLRARGQRADRRRFENDW